MPIQRSVLQERATKARHNATASANTKTRFAAPSATFLLLAILSSATIVVTGCDDSPSASSNGATATQNTASSLSHDTAKTQESVAEAQDAAQPTPVVSRRVTMKFGELRYYAGCSTCAGEGIICSRCNGTGEEPGGDVRVGSTSYHFPCALCNGAKYLPCKECAEIDIKIHPEDYMSQEEAQRRIGASIDNWSDWMHAHNLQSQ